MLRLTKDFTDIDIPRNLARLVRDEKDPMNFSFILTPEMGYWKGGLFEFTFQIPNTYPFKEPKVKCIDKVPYHSATASCPVSLYVLPLTVRVRCCWRPSCGWQIYHPNINFEG